MRKVDYVGEKFGRLTVVSRLDNYISPSGTKSSRWKCVCECGQYVQVLGKHLATGDTVSCGCYRNERRKEVKTTHGGSKDRLYRVWLNMIARCYNPQETGYSNYGGRGITLCSEWKNDYSVFRDWALNHGYDPNAARGESTIDRIDVDGNYAPDNCRFTSMREQTNNRRNNRILTYQGEQDSIANWIKRLSLNRAVVYKRIYNGWSTDDAFERPIGARKVVSTHA